MKIEKNDDFGGAILNCAVRYALGRSSYMPGLVMDEIRPMLPALSPKTLWCMERDVRDWVAGDEKDPYHDEWAGFLRCIQAQIETNRAEETDDSTALAQGWLIFSQRLTLVKLFEAWADENGVAQTCEGMVAYLFANGLLNVDAARRMIARESADER